VRVVCVWDVLEEWCVLFVTGIFKISGACCLCLGCLRGVVRVVCVWDVEEEWCVLFVTGIFKRSGSCYNTHHSC
jgi:cytochrome bd-type quinol oxidase subunit 2